ncbi:MAG: class I SAM-dependent methyltransferase [Deltaproteobacteria bacterium]|nr:class I SAM-dependent methyltransferase [Deltaproteobacteria bacterium]
MKIVDLPAQAAYDRWAATYDVKRNPMVAMDREVLVRRLDAVGRDLNGVRALDLGCGTGRNSYLLHDAGAEVTAVDFSKGMLDVGISKPGAAEIRFVTHDLNEPLPFEDAAFGVVVCTLVIEHIEHLSPLFREMRRVCAPGGWLYVSDLHPTMRLRGAQAQFSDRVRDEEVRPRGHAHRVSDYVNSILEAGLGITEMDEHFGTEALAERFPKTEEHIGWPMLLTFVLETTRSPSFLRWMSSVSTGRRMFHTLEISSAATR